jgi:hypothetical protein
MPLIATPWHAGSGGCIGRATDLSTWRPCPLQCAPPVQGEISWQGGFTAALGSSSRRLQVAGRSLRFEPPCFVSQQIVPGENL